MLRGRSTFCVARQVMLRIFNSTGMRRDLQAGGEWEVGVAESNYDRWAIGVKVSRVLGERCLQCKALAESFDCWKWVNYFLVAVQLIGAGTWRPEDIDFWMCVRLSLCVCVCFFVLSCIVSIQIWHFTFAVHFTQIANVTPNSGPL